MVSAVSNILSGARSKQLLAIKQIQRDLSIAQLKLANGKEVNSALDNPASFFTGQALSNRASDLLRLLDGINQGIKIVKETNAGIEAAQKIVDQAEALLEDARIELYASDGAPAPTILPETTDFNSYAGGQDSGGTASVENDGRDITFSGNTWKRLDVNYTITENTILQFEYKSTQIQEISAIGFDNDDSFANSTNRFFLNGTQTGGLTYADTIDAFQYDGSGDDVTVEIPVGEYFTGDFSYLTFINDHDAGSQDGNATFTDIALYESDDPPVPKDKLEQAEQYASDYAQALDQLDELVKDANYRGINLLKSDTLRINFNEDNTSFLEASGIDATSSGLRLTKHNFQTLSKITTALSQTRTARLTLREYNASIANDLNIVETRQTFIKESINTLKGGRDDLILADLNETGAEFLALQTRQQVQFSILSTQGASIANFL